MPWYTTVQAAMTALPQGSSLRSGLCCPGPSSLNRPHAPHSPAHPDFTDTAYTGCLRCASEIPGRLGDQRVVPCFHGLFSVGMSSPETPGSSSAAYTQFLHRRRWPSHTLGMSRHFSHPPPSDSRRGNQFRGFTAVHLRYNLPTCSPPLSELTRVTPSQPRLLLPRFQRIDRSHRWRV